MFSKKVSFKSSFLRHSSTSPNQQRRPLTSLLSVYFFYGFRSRTPWRPSVIMTTIIGQLDCWQLQLSGIEKYLNMSGILPRTLIGGRNELRTLIGCRNEGRLLIRCSNEPRALIGYRNIPSALYGVRNVLMTVNCDWLTGMCSWLWLVTGICPELWLVTGIYPVLWLVYEMCSWLWLVDWNGLMTLIGCCNVPRALIGGLICAHDSLCSD